MEKKKRESIFYWSPYLSNVATIKNVINSSISLKKYSKKFDITLIDTIGEWNSYKNLLEDYSINLKKISPLNISLPKTGYFRSRFYLLIIFFFNIKPLINILNKEKPKFLIVHLLTSLPLFLLIFSKFETKFILRISGLPKLNFLRKFLWRVIAHKVHAVTCPSKQTLQDLDKLKIFGINQLRLLYDPIIEVSKINYNKKDISELLTKNYFLNIGRLTKQKNQNLLIDAFHDLVEKNNQIKLYILGDGEQKKYLNIKIKSLKLENNIFLLGFKKNVFPYLKNARALISASIWEDPGATLMESAFCNTPIISSDCKNGPIEFLDNGKSGYLFQNDNLISLKSTLKNFLSADKNDLYRKTLKAKKNVKKYTIFYHYNRLIKILDV